MKRFCNFAVALGPDAGSGRRSLGHIGLSYGVMVALQFLVLSVQVRILVRQQKRSVINDHSVNYASLLIVRHMLDRSL